MLPRMCPALSYDQCLIDGRELVGIRVTSKDVREEPTLVLLDV